MSSPFPNFFYYLRHFSAFSRKNTPGLFTGRGQKDQCVRERSRALLQCKRQLAGSVSQSVSSNGAGSRLLFLMPISKRSWWNW